MNIRRPAISLFLKIVTGILIIVLLVNNSSFAQLNSRYLKQYTEKDDLPASQVYTIMADKMGFLWIGTVNGLVKYDGYEFKRYFNNPNDTASIKGAIIWAIFEDRKGLIWISAQTEWLNVYNPVTRSFRQYDFKKLVPHPSNVEAGISKITQDKNGRIYFAITTNNGEDISPGLLYMDEGSDSIKPFIPDPKNVLRNIFNLHCDTMGNTWLLGYGGIYKIDSNRNLTRLDKLTAAIFSKDEFFSDITIDKNGHAWIITNSSDLWEYNPADSTYKTFTPPGSFEKTWIANKMVFDKDENLWLGTGKGLLKFNLHTNQFETFNSESPTELEQASIRTLYFDAFGSLWMGTDQHGVFKYEERPIFKSYSHSSDDKSPVAKGWVTTILESQDGNIWNCSSPTDFTGGLNELNPSTGKTRVVLYSSITDGWRGLNSFFEYRPGEFLISTNGGTYLYSVKENKSTKVVLKGVPELTAVNQFYKDSRDNLWLCSLRGLYKQSKGTDTFTHYDLSITGDGNASSNEITRAVESKAHGLWLLTNNGLYLYNYTTDKVERHGYDKKAGDIFITQDINSLYETPDSSVWVGTWQGGLGKYNVETKKIKTYTRNDGLPSMSVQGMLYNDKDNTLWLSTFEGISRFDIATEHFNNFSISDGIQSQLFADGSALKTSRGLLAFGGSNGMTVFNPADITKNSVPPKVFLTDLKLFNKSVIPGDQSILKVPVYDTKEIVLAYNQNNISLDFIALHYANPSKNKYAYKLENYDNEWREVINQHEAFYPNLPPGKYLFHVKAANNNGVWNEQGATLSIIVNPPWWKTIWAYLAYVLIFILFSFAANRYLRQRLLEKERNRTRARELEQAKEIEKAYHTLAQTHETLKATQSQLIQSEKMASLGELTAGIAHEIQNPLNFVNNFSDVNTELLAEMKEEMDKGNINGAKAIATDVIENEQKINHHGKRADSIVKGMLQHSRASTGQKEPTDINALADEYLRLSYHGLRAKDNSYTANTKTDFDETIGKINIIPQDIGRALLNLYNNAFYAVRGASALRQGDGPAAKYEPLVTVTTRKVNFPSGVAGVEIRVKDNGNGIPQKVIDKIFQPFFTTKPTGQGTGLGLSLSYDIITKGHQGELKVETKEGEGTEFVLRLPC